MGRRIAGGDLVTAETQMKICFAVLAATTGPAASAWTRAAAHFTAAEHLGCMAASSAAAWCVQRNVTRKLLQIFNENSLSC